jgi:hypothetical protein
MMKQNEIWNSGCLEMFFERLGYSGRGHHAIAMIGNCMCRSTPGFELTVGIGAQEATKATV